MDIVDYTRYIAALVFVIAAILSLSYLLRRLGGGRFGMVSVAKSERRLKLLEIMPLDARRRLVLIGHDDREHLILLGHDRDLVVEVGHAPNPMGSGPAKAASKGSKATKSRYIPASQSADDNRDEG